MIQYLYYYGMVSPVSLVNICYHTQLQIFFLVMRMFKIFEICSIVLLTVVTLLCITSPRTFSKIYFQMF